jgi:hypothetical protein
MDEATPDSDWILGEDFFFFFVLSFSLHCSGRFLREQIGATGVGIGLLTLLTLDTLDRALLASPTHHFYQDSHGLIQQSTLPQHKSNHIRPCLV